MENTQSTQSGKMSEELSEATEEKISDQSSKVSLPYQSQKFGFLDLRKQAGHTAEKSWVITGLSAGVYSMHSSMGYLRGVKESTLSQILEDSVPEKYNLSLMACQGILTRTSTRGKVMPRLLHLAIEQQIERLKQQEQQESSTKTMEQTADTLDR